MRGARPMRSTRRLQNLQSTMPKWWSITNKAEAGQPTLVSIYDEIGFYGLPAGEFLAELSGVDGDLDVHLNSPGGDIFDGIAIYNSLKARRGTVKVTVDGLAASAASFIAQAASPGHLEMAPFSTMMIHDGFAAGIGNAADMMELAGQLNDASDNIAGIYAERTGKPASYWRAKMQATTWYKDHEAVADGLADRIRGKDGTVRDAWDLSVYNADMPDSGDGDGGWEYEDGKWRYDPDGDGDDDSTAAGDTDNSHWDASGKQIKPVPAKPSRPPARDRVTLAPRNVSWQFDLGDRVQPRPGCTHGPGHGAGTVAEVNGNAFGILFDGMEGEGIHHWYVDNELLLIEEQNQNANSGPPPMAAGAGMTGRVDPGISNADVDNSAWDAAKAWHNGRQSDNPSAFYGAICAGKKTGDPDTQAAWALPYRYTPDSPPNAAGVRNALARLSQTQGLINKEEARTKLEGLMKKINPDYEKSGNHVDSGLLSAVLLGALEGGKR